VLDRTVGLAAMVLSDNKDKLRRGVYGRPGIYRHQPWGMEYRTPSNRILGSPRVMEFIFNLTKITVELSSTHYETMKSVIPDDVVVQTLRSDDLGLARELYMRMANVFCLDALPTRGRDWEREWFGPEMVVEEEPTGLGTWGRPTPTAFEHDIEFNTEEMVEEVF